MLTNYHTHTTFCDGQSTVEEVVLTAIEKGFDATTITQADIDTYGLG